MKIGIQSEEAHLLKTAPLFDVHKWSEHPIIKDITKELLNEVWALRKHLNPKARIKNPDAVNRHLRPLLIELYVAHLSPNPWRGISRRKESYQKESRYRKIHLKYDFLIPLINNLIVLGYIEQRRGFNDHKTGKGFSSRIRATEKLISLVNNEQHGLADAIKEEGIFQIITDHPDAERETVILRNAKKENIEYDDTIITTSMRGNLSIINTKLKENKITLKLTDEQFLELKKRLAPDDDEDREHVDFSRKSLCRIFNEDFEHGGRFYGGWWIGIPQEYRKFIQINLKHTVEVDYSGHHIRMLYAEEGLKPPADPYNWDGCPFSREELKQVFLILINASSRGATLKSCAKKGIKGAEAKLTALEQHHQSVSHYFHSGVGISLQYKDSVIAERVMLEMIEKSGAVVLPVHDSFIVRASYQEELESVMNAIFKELYGLPPIMKPKKTILSQDDHEYDEETIGSDLFVTDDLDELLPDISDYSKFIQLWGVKGMGG